MIRRLLAALTARTSRAPLVGDRGSYTCSNAACRRGHDCARRLAATIPGVAVAAFGADIDGRPCPHHQPTDPGDTDAR